MKHLSWDEVDAQSRALAEKVRASLFEPDVLIGIATGGLVPLLVLAKQLGVKEVLTIAARSYDKGEQKQLFIGALPDADLAGKRVLVVDEIADSGVTLGKIMSLIQERYTPSELKSAVLYVHGDNCKQYPDIWIEEVKEWVAFPWERDELPGS
ncbi:hypothetical protein HY968_03355 [Candidatus Kaiserbacteria bacterium]|nr:hypothetical protein [Candidatus Kaiserbacteria bacterium]